MADDNSNGNGGGGDGIIAQGNKIANFLNGITGQPQVGPNDAIAPGDNLGAVPNMLTGGMGIKTNTINIILNTLFYSTITAVGLYILIRGLFALSKEMPGASGAASYLGSTFGDPAKKLAGAAAFIGTDGLSSFGSALGKPARGISAYVRDKTYSMPGGRHAA